MEKNHSVSTNTARIFYMEHPVYEVTNQDGDNVGVSILILYYGRLWELAIRSLDHKMDGYMFTIQHMNKRFKVYRKVEVEIKKEKSYNQSRAVR